MTETLAPENLNSPGSFTPPSAPDPTAHVKDESESKPKIDRSTLYRYGIPTSLTELKSFGPRYYLIKLISWVLLIQGVLSLKDNLHEIFVTFPQIPSLYKAFNFSHEIYSAIVYKSVIITATSATETIFGLSLVTKGSKLIKNFHLIAGIALIILSFVLLKLVSPVDLNSYSNAGLAMRLHFLPL